jgi:CRISPR-associated protein Csc2
VVTNVSYAPMTQERLLGQYIPTLQSIQSWFLPDIPRLRQGKMIHIVLLRETRSYAIFTTEGSVLDTERLQAGIKAQDPLSRVVMYKRKQVAAERRRGKELLREYGVIPIEDAADEQEKGKKAKKETGPVACRLMDGVCGRCPDCILYGFAAVKNEGSQRSRILTDSAWSVRDYPTIQKYIKLNAIDETVAGGVAGSAFSQRDHVLPQVFLPCVETLVDVTATELVYVLGNIFRTTRYGAESNREGTMRNHLLGIYCSDVELFSNLDLTQMFYDAFVSDTEIAQKLEQGYLAFADFEKHKQAVLQQAQAEAMAVVDALSDQQCRELREQLNKLYSNETALHELLETMYVQSQQYADRMRKEASKKGQPQTEEE